jgi:hypothetical protein
VALLLPWTLSALAGCVDDQSLQIVRFIEPDPLMNCEALPTSMFNRTSGLLDVGIVAAGGFRGYVAAPLVQNNLPSKTVPNQIDNNTITVTGTSIDLTVSPSLSAALPSSQRSFSTQAAAGTLTPAGQATFFVELVPRQVALLLAPSVPTGVPNTQLPVVTAHVKPVGDRAGTTIVGPEVQFPVEICKFCLTAQPAPCPAGGIPVNQVQKGGCLPEQDQAVTCCTNSSGALLCGSEVPTAAAM